VAFNLVALSAVLDAFSDYRGGGRGWTGRGRRIGCADAGDGGDAAQPGSRVIRGDAGGLGRQQAARRLTGALIDGRERVIRRFGAFTGGLPWQWTPGQVETWIAEGGWAHSTIRSYQGAVALFLAYACDPGYGWVAECEQQAGARPVQIVHEWNTAVHVAGYEGRPGRRPLTRAELRAFFDTADDHVEAQAAGRSKGWLASFRDATLFKVIYGWGCAALLGVQRQMIPTSQDRHPHHVQSVPDRDRHALPPAASAWRPRVKGDARGSVGRGRGSGERSGYPHGP
jgi:hypothetical protein